MQSDLENHKWLTWCFLALLSLLVAGCVRPEGVTETGTPGAIEVGGVPTVPSQGGVVLPPAPTQPVVSANAAQIQQYFQANLGFTPNNVQVLGRLNLPSGLDALDIFLYQNNAGQRCTGIIQISGQQILVGDGRCSTDGVTVAGALLFQPLNNPNFYIVVYGYVDPVIEPTASAASIVFPNGTSSPATLAQGGFIFMQQGLDFPREVVFVRVDGNTINRVPIQ